MLKDWRRKLKVWMPALIGIPAMLLLGYWFEAARFFLFAHHMFWIVGIILLINPVSETLWPSATPDKAAGRLSPQPSAKAQERRKAHKLTEKQKPASASETPAERLARLQKQKEAMDQNIEKIATQIEKRVK